VVSSARDIRKRKTRRKAAPPATITLFDRNGRLKGSINEDVYNTKYPDIQNHRTIKLTDGAFDDTLRLQMNAHDKDTPKTEEAMKDRVNNTSVSSPSTQIITVNTKSNQVFQITWSRSLTNVHDGRLNMKLNRNGINLFVAYTNYTVTQIK